MLSGKSDFQFGSEYSTWDAKRGINYFQGLVDDEEVDDRITLEAIEGKAAMRYHVSIILQWSTVPESRTDSFEKTRRCELGPSDIIASCETAS